jgi:hypothetical protein
MSKTWIWSQRVAGAVGVCACFWVMLRVDFWDGVAMAAFLGLAAGVHDAIEQD